jgi:hypothetical protein
MPRVRGTLDVIATTPPQLFLLEGQKILGEYKDWTEERRLVQTW